MPVASSRSRATPLRDEPEIVAVQGLRIAQRHRQRVVAGDLLGLPLCHFKCVLLEDRARHQLGLEDRHVLAEADAGPRLEDRELVRCGLGERDPTVGVDLEGLRVPRPIAPHGKRQEDDVAAGGHAGAVGEDVVPRRNLQVGRHRRVEPERLVEHAVQVRHLGGPQLLEGRGALTRAPAGDLLAELPLDLRVSRQDEEHPGQQACSSVPAGDDEVQDDVLQERGRETLLVLALDKQSEQVRPIRQPRVGAAGADEPPGLRVERPAGCVELPARAAGTLQELPQQAPGAAYRPRQERHQPQRQCQPHHNLDELPVGCVVGRGVGAVAPAHGVGRLGEEDLHDTVHREAEEQLLHVHLLSEVCRLLQHSPQLRRLRREDRLHAVVEVPPGEDGGGDLPLPRPAVAPVLGPRAVPHGEEPGAQPLPQVVPDVVPLALRLRIVVEVVLEHVLQQERIAAHQLNARGVERQPNHLAQRKASACLLAPLVHAEPVPDKVLQETCHSTRLVPRKGHRSQGTLHPPHHKVQHHQLGKACRHAESYAPPQHTAPCLHTHAEN
mmetsp:Transcript_88596/g.274385  ORF Transcript_88596/g.274385 Transcript_88596/m.274385 type:complete len:553 (-) Transcript_88596:25-1683(-)